MNFGRHANRLMGILSIALALGTLPTTAQAGDLFKSGWVLDSARSSLSFEVVINQTTKETLTISNLEGMIGADGTTAISIDLNSIDTRDDLRDTRMRYVLFETFNFPTAKISAELDERLFAAFDDLRIYHTDLRASLDLHGVRRKVTAETVATMFDDETISIASVDPVIVRAKDFNFTGGLQKLQEAYFGEAAPYAAVSFDLVFKALPHVETPDILAERQEDSDQAIVNGRSTAVEPKEVCVERLSKLSAAKNLHFRNGSHQLSSDSLVVLAKVVGAIRPCDALKITVAGHTDDVGDEAFNKVLSQRRADHVTKYLVRLGLPETRVFGEGYGETRPIAPNDSAANRSKNRRIEFSVEEG